MTRRTGSLIALLAVTCLWTDAPAAVRDDLRRVLWMGGMPDRALVDGVAPAQGDDSTLVASALLALGDTVGALAWSASPPDTTAPAWEIIEARRLLLFQARGEPRRELIDLWRRTPSTAVGRQCALAALRGPLGREARQSVAGHLDGWPSSQRADAWLRIAALHHQTGQPDSAIAALWSAVETGASPFASVAAESLLAWTASDAWESRRREVVAAVLFAGGRAHAALTVLPSTPASDTQRLLRARALLAAGRSAEGVAALRRLARDSAPLAADALWFLAGYEKRVDEDSLAAEHYHSLVKRFPSSSRAPDALWESAWAFERIGHYQRAGLLYREALRRWPHGPNADNSRFRWGLAAWRIGDITAAKERWTTTWPYLRDARAKAAVAYWLGKARLWEGRFDDARVWWERARDAAPGSFYGLRAQQRMAAAHVETRQPVRSSSVVLDFAGWVRGWSPGASALADTSLLRAQRLYDLGFAREADAELRRALDTAGQSAHGVVEVLRQARAMESPGVVAAAASRLGEMFQTRTGEDPPQWLDRLGMPVPFPSCLRPIADELGLDPCLVSALIRKESYYDQTAVSHAGAVGLMQLMPHTAAATARRVPGLDPSRRTEVMTNLRLGCLHLREVLDAHSGSLIRALAAYNAGNIPVQRWVSALPIRDDELWVECLTYSETRYYVKTVLGFTWRYQALWPALAGDGLFDEYDVE